MKRISLFAMATLSILSLVHPWTHDLQDTPIQRIASTQNYTLVQIDANIPLAGGVVGNKCTGGWMRVEEGGALELMLNLKSRNLDMKRLIFSSSDTAVVIQGNPNALAWCRVDWVEGF